jgi:hypothetical protein
LLYRSGGEELSGPFPWKAKPRYSERRAEKDSLPYDNPGFLQLELLISNITGLFQVDQPFQEFKIVFR